MSLLRKLNVFVFFLILFGSVLTSNILLDSISNESANNSELLSNEIVKLDSYEDSIEMTSSMTTTAIPLNTTTKLDLNDMVVITTTPPNESKVHELSVVLKRTIQGIRQKYKKMDIVFLIDSSSSVGKTNFLSELKFVTKFLSDFNVSYNYTRVAIVTFSSQGKIVRNVDQISEVDENNDKCELLNHELPKIKFSGGGTFTAGALKQAKNILSKARRHAKKLVCLITDGFSNGQNPLPIADKLKNENITIITFGIQAGNSAELYNISSSPRDEHSFLLDSFTQFESLARKALHSDYRLGNSVRIKTTTYCDALCDNTNANDTSSCCDTNAECTCSTVSGHYSCVCKPGYYGSGFVENCQLCPNGTYWHTWNLCRPCPDINHITGEMPALNSTYCVCKDGFKADENNRCEILKCPLLKPPEHGYFVKHPTNCGSVLNTACGARCKSGYQLIGSSIRLCQENGTWSGTESKCVLKTCPKLSIPYYGMATCKNADLNLFFDYTPRNESFMEAYDKDDQRTTELMPIDTDCNFKCGPGFYMVGSTMRNCLPLSKWDGIQTACKQILCPTLPEVKFGQYDPTDCTSQKAVHGSNCTLSCDAGFEVKGPSIKSCAGKRTGVWSNRNKIPKCVDVTPPELTCPQNFTVPMDEDENFAIVKIFPAPNVTDNSDGQVTFWLKPAVQNDGVKLTLGNHTFTYVAVDAFKNKAKCNFTITVLDITAPAMDNCIDPPEIFIPVSPNAPENLTFVDWDPPIIYDNSNTEVNVTQSIESGQLGVGQHQVHYVAIDLSGNKNQCVMNVTVKPAKCNVLSSPSNGESLCAKNATHTWCDITCDIGFTIFKETIDDHLDTIKLFCNNDYAKWQYESVPDCTKTELPEEIEQVFSITLDVEPIVCNDSESSSQFKNDIQTKVREQLCQNISDCEIVTELPDCSEVQKNQNASLIDLGHTNKTFYKIVKRDTNAFSYGASAPRVNMQLRVYTRISKKLGIWDSHLPRSENIQNVKEELKTYHTNENLRNKLHELRINVKHLNLEEIPLCRNGTVPKKGICVQCPRGTFHNRTTNNCQLCPFGSFNDQTGQMYCRQCASYHSTRKLGAKSSDECAEQCPPGTTARIRLRTIANQKMQKSLMPFCRKCLPGQYQENFDEVKCLNCPAHYLSPRGAISISNCYPEQRQACNMNPTVCGPHGICEQVIGNIYLYSCLCEEEFIGSHCERQLNLCASAPCYNGGECNQVNSTNIVCKCSKKFTGEFCEIEIDNCSNDVCYNGGTCIESDRRLFCECLSGFTGDFCEIKHNYCAHNPCESGQCLNTADGFLCKCPPGVIGRRCHLRPCDYFPCHRNAHCLDLHVFPATRNSYICQCPKGLKGYNCSQIKSACEQDPCRNNGICQAMALRHPSLWYGQDDEQDESIYEKYTCKCPPYFYGEHCEIFTTPDFVMEFTKPGVHNYVKLDGPMDSLNEISFCTWIQTNDSFNYGTILSYATETSDNMFTLTDYNGFVLYVNGNNIITDITLNDGEWHFICVTWSSVRGSYSIYIDGNLRDSGINLNANEPIEANGTLIIGQEQDSLGTSFSESESFVGRIAYLDIWNKVISAAEMFDYYTTCEPYQGNLYAWPDFKNKIKGVVKITRSPFCKPCSQNLFLSNGYIRYLSNRAFHYCYEGYRLKGPSIRNCLRTSRWSLPVPYCRSIRCGYLPGLLNGNFYTEKTSYGERVVYSCNENFYLVGVETRLCQSNSTWSGAHPECISKIHCGRLAAPPNSQIVYANERGRIRNDQGNYPMGTFVEIQCENGTTIYGESFLSCTEGGTWDFPTPKCISPDTTTEATFTKPQERFTTYATDIADLLLTTEPSAILISTLPDKEFWLNLKSLFYVGCEDIHRVHFCSELQNETYFTDLTSFELPDNDEFRHMDVKLLALLNDVQRSLKIKSISNKLNVENLFKFILYGNIVKEPPNQMTQITENSFRLVLCLYIDTIVLDKSLNLATVNQFIKNDENITQKLKVLLTRIVSIVYQNYQLSKKSHKKNEFNQMAVTTNSDYSTTEIIKPITAAEISKNSNRNLRSTFVTDDFTDSTSSTVIEDGTTLGDDVDITTSNEDTNTSVDVLSFTTGSSTSATDSESVQFVSSTVANTLDTLEVSTKIFLIESQPQEEICHLNTLPESPLNSFIINIVASNKTIISSDPKVNGTVPIHTKVYYGCKTGYKSNQQETIFSECINDSKWINTTIKCEAIPCDKPSKLSEMIISSSEYKNIYYFGQKLQLKCNEGYELHGDSFTGCLPNGKWPKVLSSCSRIRN